MASISNRLILSLFLYFSLFAAVHPNRHRHRSTHPTQPISNPQPSSGTNPKNEIIHQACKASRDPPICEEAISESVGLPENPNLVDVITSAMGVSTDGIKTAESFVNEILGASEGNLNRTNAAKTCLEVLDYSVYRIDLSSNALPQGNIKDARAWMSAAIVYQYDCWSALKYVNGTAKVNETMSFLDTLIQITGNALGMMVNYDNFGNKTHLWGPAKTERDGFWEGSNGSGNPLSLDFAGGVPKGLKADATVCKGGGGGCDYDKIQKAVDAAPINLSPGQRFVIWIKVGKYEEIVRVPLEKKNIVFLGDGMGKTVISGSMNVGHQQGISTMDTATVGVIGDGFMASDLTIENTAGPDAHQAVAFRSDSDVSVIENCEFLGNQDTLYAHTLRQFYKSCRIQGNVDFIFGNSATIFQDCLILVSPRQVNPEKGETNAITAHGRIDPAQSTGFVFQNCIVNGTEEYMSLYYSNPKVHQNFLGRPWKQYSRTVFILCTLEAMISPSGWLPWDGNFALNTLYYGEFRNNGAGAKPSGRVNWCSQIAENHVSIYSVQNFIQGDQWIPTKSS